MRHDSDGLQFFRRVREQTLSLVLDLDQVTADAVPEPGRWSVGEVLDHLVRADVMFRDEIRELCAREWAEKAPFLVRGLKTLGGPGANLPLPLRLPIESGLAFMNLGLPARAREWLFKERRFRTQAPSRLRPIAGRPVHDLLNDLAAMVEELASSLGDPRIDAGRLYYYSPIVGYTTASGLLRIAASHDLRHQQQLREALRAARCPHSPHRPTPASGDGAQCNGE